MAKEHGRPDVERKRRFFENIQPLLNPKHLVFVDESGFRLGGTPRYGWAPIGKDAPGCHVQGKWETVTMVGAMALDGFRGFMTIDAGTSADVFLAFVENQLIPNLAPDDIVVMDNLNAHKSPSVIEAIEKTGAQVLFTPPYSPEFNPIEKAWGKIKDILRRLDTESRELFDDAVAIALDEVSLLDRKGWINHAGYSIN